MKKASIALAVSCVAAGASQAQSSVTLYGLADAGYSHVSGQTAARQRLVSGIMEGSRFGLKGNEDLGGGYRAIFTLENRLEIDTGALSNRPASGSQLPARFNSAAALGLPAPLQPAVTAVASQLGDTLGVNLAGNLFDRQAFVGVITPVGAVLAGRQYTPIYELLATFDVMRAESSLSFAQIATLPAAVEIRTSNALSYRFQTGPWAASAMLALGEGSTAAGRMVAANAFYKTSEFSVGLGYQSRENERAEKSLTNFGVGASASIGPGTLYAQYINVKDDDPSGLEPVRAGLAPAIGPVFAAAVAKAFGAALRQDANGYHVGYRIIADPHTVSVAYSRYDDKLARNADVQSYGTVYSYALSKRTDLNFVLTHFDNSATAQTAPGQNGFLGGVTSEPGRDATNVALGVRHRF